MSILSLRFRYATVLFLVVLSSFGFAQSADVMKRVMEGMKTHELSARVVIVDSEGNESAAPSGLDVGIQVKVFGRSKTGPLMFKTDDRGLVQLIGVRSNADPSIQAQMSYEAFVDYEGVRFPFPLEIIPRDGMTLEPFRVFPVSGKLNDLGMITRIDIHPTEQSLRVIQEFEFVNRSKKAIALDLLGEDGLRIRCPEGAKQPEVHGKDKSNVEIRGLDIFYKGTILPQGDVSNSVKVIYSLPYRSKTFKWAQDFPIDVLALSIATPHSKASNHVKAVRLQLLPRNEGAKAETFTDGRGGQWRVVKMIGEPITAGTPLNFDIANIPAPSRANLYFLVVSIIVLTLVVVFGFRAGSQEARALSKSHLTEERDRLLKAMARLAKALERGIISPVKHRKETEAIKARLVSLYRAIDRLNTR